MMLFYIFCIFYGKELYKIGKVNKSESNFYRMVTLLLLISLKILLIHKAIFKIK